MHADKDKLYWDLRTENDDFIRRQQWWWKHYNKGTLVSRRRQAAKELGAEGEAAAAKLIRELLGYQAHPTTRNCSFDLWVADTRGQAARVEVKASLYSETYRRYEFDVRQGEQDVDVVICMAKNGAWWPYIIPIAAVGQRQNVAIWSACPGDYKGQWQVYLNAWQHLEQAVTNSFPRTWQLSFL